MGRTMRLIMALGAIACIGCMPSLHPLYLPENVTLLKGIEGKWENDSSEIGDESWEFARHDSLSYDLIYTENGQAEHFDVHIVKLKEYLFIDMSPQQPETDNDLYKSLLLPLHLFGRVWLEGDSLRMGFLDGDWLDDKVKKREIAIGMETGEGDQVLTAQTQDIQAMVLKYVDNPEAFPSQTLTRAEP